MESIASTSARRLAILTEDDAVPGYRFDKDPDYCTVDQIKRWLKCRGLKQSGKRSELVKRVRDCIFSGNHRILDVSIDDGKWFAAKVLKESKNPSNVQQDESNRIQKTPTIPSANWNNFQSQDIPSMFNYGHIHYYALESIKVVENVNEDDENDDHGLGHMTDRPLKNARKYVDSGFVHDIMDARSDEHYFARAHVWPSMRNDLPHNVLVILSKASGAVIHASCEPCKVSALGRCSHVAALLLYLHDHVEKHGPTVTVPCTSKPCTWNKGKKRDKNPQRLSSTSYPSKVKKSSKVNLIDFDPWPTNRRHVKNEHINDLMRDLHTISSKNENGDVSMWETLIEMTYDDYSLDAENENILKEKIKQLLENLTPPRTQEMPHTQNQSECEDWSSQRFWRLTASNCLTACRIGKLVRDGSKDAAIRAYNFIYSNIWKMEPHCCTTFMKYGLESEAKAIQKYEEQTQNKVFQTGLWVNPTFPFLGCSPDGLVDDDGLLEIKSLKVFKENTIEDVTSGNVSIAKDVLSRQCFSIKDGKCYLKTSHSYYYQIQMQLLVTERKLGNFV